MINVAALSTNSESFRLVSLPSSKISPPRESKSASFSLEALTPLRVVWTADFDSITADLVSLINEFVFSTVLRVSRIMAWTSDSVWIALAAKAAKYGLAVRYVAYVPITRKNRITMVNICNVSQLGVSRQKIWNSLIYKLRKTFGLYRLIHVRHTV